MSKVLFMENNIIHKILQLRQMGKTYAEIGSILGYSKKVVGYHCRKNGLGDQRPSVKNIDTIAANEFYKTHTLEETATFFGVKAVSLKYYLDAKKTCEDKLSDEERKKRNTRRVSDRRRRIKQLAIDYKGGKCEICGYNTCNGALEFHHKDPTEKEFNIARSGHCRTWENTRQELDKCILVCSNCHKEIHAGIENNNKAVDSEKVQNKKPVDKKLNNKVLFKEGMKHEENNYNCACGNLKTKSSKHCFECELKYRKKKRKFDVEPEELKKLVWSMPTSAVSKMFGVSDKAIEKRCKLLGVEKPPRGYWTKQQVVSDV